MMKKNTTGCVILNYNDAETTIEQVERIRHFSVLDWIVMVDNHSTDSSWLVLEEKRRQWGQEKIVLLGSEKNGGYGSGNNLGLRFCAEEKNCDFVLVANPDTEFTEKTVISLKKALETCEDAAAAACVMKDDKGKVQGRGWRLLPWYLDLLASGPICRRLFPAVRRLAEYSPDYFSGKQAALVDAVHGSMVMVNGKKMLAAGGYDENVFLYEEEVILASRLKKIGGKTWMLPGESYIHRDSVTTSRVFNGLLKRQKLRRKSTMYYYREYLGCGKAALTAARLFLGIIELEDLIWERFVWPAVKRGKE